MEKKGMERGKEGEETGEEGSGWERW